MTKNLLYALLTLFLLTGCTVAITLTDTHGVSDDVVDETSSTDANVKADASIPLNHE
jgi:uncharacterized protein YcfL